MIEVNKLGILLEKTTRDFENEGVLNPAVIRVGDNVHIFYRAVSRGNYSSIGYCMLEGPTKVVKRLEIPLISIQFDYESHGIEDPRITQIDGLYYMTYTAFDGVNALGALATSNDLVHWEKKGIIVPKLTYDEFKVLAEAKSAVNIKYLRLYQMTYSTKQLFNLYNYYLFHILVYLMKKMNLFDNITNFFD